MATSVNWCQLNFRPCVRWKECGSRTKVMPKGMPLTKMWHREPWTNGQKKNATRLTLALLVRGCGHLFFVASVNVFTINPVFPLDKGMQRTVPVLVPGSAPRNRVRRHCKSPPHKAWISDNSDYSITALLHFVRGNLFAMSFQLILWTLSLFFAPINNKNKFYIWAISYKNVE